MNRFSHFDVIVELVDLGVELVSDVRQQLAYYRASVYKDETAIQLRERVEHLRCLAALMNEEMFMEPFRDHDAMAARGALEYIPGECTLSTRTSRLLGAMEDQFQNLAARVKDERLPEQYGKSFTMNLKKHRHEIMAMCKYGSRHWSFFQSL
jgi:hypothetical protein